MKTKEKTLEEIPSRISLTDVIERIRDNQVRFQYFTILKDISDFSDKIIANLLNVNEKTFRSYRNKTGTIKNNIDLQEHTLMLLSLMKHGIEVFGSKEDFAKWLKTQNFHFDDKPLSFLNTISGIKFIHDRLTGMEYGDNA